MSLSRGAAQNAAYILLRRFQVALLTTLQFRRNVLWHVPEGLWEYLVKAACAN
jgi:hypothetical protein